MDGQNPHQVLSLALSFQVLLFPLWGEEAGTGFSVMSLLFPGCQLEKGHSQSCPPTESLGCSNRKMDGRAQCQLESWMEMRVTALGADIRQKAG